MCKKKEETRNKVYYNVRFRTIDVVLGKLRMRETFFCVIMRWFMKNFSILFRRKLVVKYNDT